MKWYFALIALGIMSCSSDNTETTSNEKEPPLIKEAAPKTEAKSDYFYTVDFNEGNGWGYSIFKGSALFIQQKTIPSIPGNSGFQTREDAEKVAEYVTSKLENDIFPPSVNPKELDSLGVSL